MLTLALIGTFGGFFLAWIPFSFSAFVSIIALVGIVVNNAIVISYRKDGMTVQKAAAHGVSDRLRPILTTGITTIIGLMPLALSSPRWMPLCKHHHLRPNRRHGHCPDCDSLSVFAVHPETIDEGLKALRRSCS